MGGGGTNSSTQPAAGSMNIQSSLYGAAIPMVYGNTRIAGNLIWYGDFTSTPHTSSAGGGGKGGGGGGGGRTTYTYSTALIMALGEGGLTVGKVWRDKKQFDSLTDAGLSQMTGTIGQAMWGYLQTSNPDQALAYSGLAYVYAPKYELGESTQIDNHGFEVTSSITTVASGDASPAVCAVDMLTNPRYGADFPASMMGSTADWHNYAMANNLLVSMALTAQKPASECLQYALAMSNTDVVWSQGKLKFVPLGDKPVTGNGITYTPNTTPAYDLTEADFLTDGTDDPLIVERKANDDTFNCIKVEYTDRADSYSKQIAEARDAADVDVRGIRTSDTVEAHALHDAQRAGALATLLLQKEMGIRNTYKFTLPWTFALLEPLDLVTVTDPFLGLYRVPVRINSVSETNEGDFEIEAEDCPIGMASAPQYGNQAGKGFSHDYNAPAGNVTTPVFFEPPIERTTTGLEVWAAVSGNNPLWGGCNVWASLDGMNYKRVSRVEGGVRYGTTTTAMSGSDAAVGVALVGKGGTMLTASSTDAAQLASLCWVGTTAGGEFMAHQGAAITGTNAYSLAGMQRGAYTCPAVAHVAGSQFVRVDDAIAKSDPLDLSMIGQPIYFKFTSFNVYFGGEQSIADVPSYTYTITGNMVKLPPSSVQGLAASVTSNGVLLAWDKSNDADYALTEIREGASWDSAAVVTRKSSTTHLLPWLSAGVHQFLAKSEDKLGNQSAAAVAVSINIAAPSAVQMETTEMQGNALVFQWLDAKTDQPILRYEYFYGTAGATLAQCVSWGSAGSDGRSDVRYFRTPGLKQIYIVAYDLAGNASTPTSFSVTSTMPNDFILASERYEDWQTSELDSATIINGSNGQILIPVADQTWGDHFASRSYADAQAQVSAGFPFYWQPAELAGSHTERMDTGRVIAGGVINVGVTATELGTGAVATVSIRYSADELSWSSWYDALSLQASDFRYVEVRYAVASGGHGAFLVDDVHIEMRLQSITEITNLALNPADTVGTFYPTIKPFLDLQNVQVTPLASPSIYRVNPVIKDDTAPFGVYVQAWDSNNNRVGGTVSLTITGV